MKIAAPGPLRAWRSPDTLLISGLLLACLAAVVFLPVTFSSRARAAQDALFLRADPLQNDGQDLNAAMLNMETGERGFLLTGDESFLSPYAAGRQDFNTALANAQPLAHAAGGDVEGSFTTAVAAAQSWQSAADAAIGIRRAGGQPSQDGTGVLFDAYRAAYTPLNAVLLRNRQAARDSMQTIENDRNAATAAAGVAVALLAIAYFRLLLQRARLRDAERRSAHYIRRLMDSLRDPVVVFDGQTNAVRDANRAAEEVSGYTHGELLAMSAADLRVPAERGAPRLAAIDGVPQPQRVTWQRKDGATVPMEFISALATFSNERVIVASGRDIQRRLEDEAEREALLRQTESARADAEAARERMTDVLESMSEAFFSFDHEWRFLYLNPKAEQLAGHSRAEVVGRVLWEVLPQTTSATFYSRYHQAVEEQTPQAFETYLPHLGAWFAITAYPTTDGLAAYWQNIDARKLVEADREALLRRERVARAEAEASERRYRVLAETMPQIVWAAAPDGTIDYYNQRFYDYTGITPAQSLHDGGWAHVVHPDELARTLALWRDALRTGTTMEHEFRLQRGADGAYRWHLLRAVPIHDDAGGIARWLGVCVDMDDRRRAGEEVRQSRDHLAAVFGSIHDGIMVLDPRGRIVTANEAAARAFGYASPEAAAGRMLGEAGPDLDVLDETGAPFPYEAFPSHRVLSGDADAEALVRISTTSSGEERWLLVRATPLHGEDGRIENAIVSFHDITERQQTEELRRVAENLTRSNTALQEFAYVASHDLQEPLRMIASYTQLLQRRYHGRLDVDADDFIRYAVDGATRMKQLIQDLLAYSRVETRGGSLQLVDCAALVAQVLHDLSVAIEEGGATVQVAPLPVLYGDPTQLRQVFQNLIGNAVKFRGDAPPTVQVGCERRGAELVFSVADNGIGIDPQYAERIFVVFQRLHTREAYPGTGIGLALCKKIVERHGGRIWMESRAGQGATFFFALPALVEGRGVELIEAQSVSPVG